MTIMMRFLLLLSLASTASAFMVAPTVASSLRVAAPALHMMDPNLLIDQTATVASSLLLAETEPWIQPLALVLDPFLNLFSFAMVR
jgi:hypothetical protein